MNSLPSESLIKTLVIVGGGTAGWMTAAALSKVLKGRYTIKLVESEEIGTVGVGEATIPMIRHFNKLVGLDEDEFLRQTQGTFKLAIEFVNWGRLGERYMHGFGHIGQDLWTVNFEQYWLKMYAQGRAADLGEYSITRMAAAANKFMRPPSDLPNSPLGEIAYAFHFDANLYAKYLRKISEAAGVQRFEGKVAEVTTQGPNQHVDSVVLEDGRRIDGELFLDCSGFRGLLIEQALQTGYEDWSHWLPCDRAVAVPCASAPTLLPYTRATARSAGWQWRIPLQHRIGNGHVFASKFMSEDEATATLMANLDGEPLAAPRTLRFTTGMRSKAWNRNVVAIGLAGGFMEPLESTSIHLVQSTIAKLITFFPDRGFSQVDVDEFNRQSRFEFEKIRDFLILHYHQTQRDDSAFWNHCRTMEIPASLQQKIDLFRSHGRVVREGAELFAEVGWIQVMHGQGLRAERHHPLTDLIEEKETEEYLDGVRGVIRKCVEVMPDHAEFIARHCAAAR
ncbi:MAG: Flavin-dependent tryptophan halogenase PrnA [Pseudomonadota bacterium]